MEDRYFLRRDLTMGESMYDGQVLIANLSFFLCTMTIKILLDVGCYTDQFTFFPSGTY